MAQDDESYTNCPENLTDTQCYSKIVRTPDDGYDVNDTSIDQANKLKSVAKLSLQQQESNKTYTLEEPSRVYYEGLDWWGICINSLVRSYISQPCETLVSPDPSCAYIPRKSSVRERSVSKRSICVFTSTFRAADHATHTWEQYG